MYNESFILLYLNPTAHTSNIFRIKYAQDGLVVTAATQDTIVKVWNSSFNWNLIGTYTNHTGYVQSLVCLNADSMASGDFSGNIKIWSISSLTTIRTILTGAAIYSLALLNNGLHLATGHNPLIQIWNISNSLRVATLSGHSSIVADLVTLSDELLASSGVDLTVRIWNVTSYTLKYTLNGHTNYVNGLKVIAADVLASGSKDTTILLWNITSGSLVKNLTNHTNSINYGLDLYDSQTLISGSYDSTMKLWHISTGTVLKTINTIPISSIAVIGIVSNTCKSAIFE